MVKREGVVAYWSRWKGWLTLGLVLLLIALPVFAHQRRAGEDPLAARRPTPVPWQGVLQLYVLEGWEGSRGTAWLKRRCAAFESVTGAFVEVRTVQALDMEQPPDVVSFPAGMDMSQAAASWLAISLPSAANRQFREGILSTGILDGQLKAVPWLLGGYTLVANETLCAQKGMALPELGMRWNEAGFMESLKAFKGSKKVVALSVLQRDCAQRNLPEGCVASLPNGAGNRDAFHKGNVPFLLGDVRDLALLEQAGFAWQQTPLEAGMVCDEVCYLGVTGRGDTRRQQMAQALVAYLVSADVQAQVDKAGGFSPLALQVYDDGAFAVLEARLDEGITLFGAFGNEIMLAKPIQAQPVIRSLVFYHRLGYTEPY